MHVLITGASKGIGLAVARKFSASHHGPLRLSLCSRHPEEIKEIAPSLEASSAHVQVYADTCDVSDTQQVYNFTEEAQRRFGTVDLLVNNAGFGIFRPLDEMKTEEFDSVIATNLRGVFLVTHALLPRMIARKTGTIVTISSLAGKNGFAGGAAYCAAKFGVRGLMQSLFLEVREHNIRVVTIFPGSVDTHFFSPGRGTGQLKSAKALQADDIADCLFMATQLPTRADISELDIRPTNPKG